MTKKNIKIRALFVAATYLVFGVAWILITDSQLFEKFSSQIINFYTFQIYKGLFYIFITAVLVYCLAYFAMKHQAAGIERQLENEKHLNALTAHTKVGIYDADTSGRITYCNDRLLEIIGIVSRDNIDQGWIESLYHDDHKRIVENWESAIESGNPFHEVYRYQHADGRIVWVTEDSVPWHDSEGKLRGYIGTITDITSQKQSEFALQMNNFAIEKTGDAIFWINPDATFFFVNDAACASLGYDREELLKKSIFDIDPDFSESEWATTWNRLQHDGSEILETRHQHSDGHIFPVEVRANYLEFEGKAYDCAVVRDITARKEAERALQESEKRLEHLMRANPCVLYALQVIDGKFVPAWVSGSITRILGYTTEEALHITWWPRHIHPDDRENCLERVRTVLEKNSLVHEYRFLHKNGQEIWIRDELRVVRDSKGQPIEIIGVWNDITEIINTENKLRQAQKLDAIGKLTSGVAHDFNNRLTVILGNLQLLERQLENKQDLKHLASSAIDAAKAGATLTQRLLSFSRQQVLETDIINVNNLVVDVSNMLEKILEEIINIELRLDDDLWPVKVDSGQLQEVMINLCVNARDAMPEGGNLIIETGNITFEEDHDSKAYRIEAGDYINISVSDTGSGMDKETLERVFEPFFTTKKKGKVTGTGLGLAMVYGFVKQSMGYINIYSEPGNGTCVNIYLPRCKEQSTKIRFEYMKQKNDENIQTPLPTNITVLVVEDDEFVRNISTRLLNELGCNVLEAGNAAEGISMLENQKNIDLVFSDMMMPGGMNGVEMVEKMRESKPYLKAIIVSGYSEDTVLKKEMNIQWLKKPFTRENLVTKLKETLGKNHGNE